MGQIRKKWLAVTAVLSFVMVIAASGVPARVRAAGNVITCTSSIGYPHASHHFPGNVNVVSQVVCDAPVSNLVIGIALKRYGAIVGNSGSCAKQGTNKLKCNAWEPCHSGALYSGVSNVSMTPPPGYKLVGPAYVTDTAQERQAFCDASQPAVNPGTDEYPGPGPAAGQLPPIPTSPVASFTSTRLTGAGNRITLDASSSYDTNGGSVAKWEWRRDGQVVGNTKVLTISLGTATTANISLKVTNNLGLNSPTTQKTITAYNRTPVLTGSLPASGATSGDNTPTLSATSKDDDADPLQYNFRIYGPSVDVSSGWSSNSSWTVPASRLDPGVNYTWTVQARDPKFAYTPVRTSTLQIAMLPTASEMVSTSTGKGYWQVATDGGVFSYGDAQFRGSLPGLSIRVDNIIGMARTPTDNGYWLVGRDGGVFAFGDAVYANSLTGLGIQVNNIVGMAPTKDGKGYWLVGSDGGVFAFGTAGFYGSMGGKPLNKPVEAMAPTASSQGYWLVAQDGGVFAFGDAPFLGSKGGQPLNHPVIDMDTTPDGKGYWLTAEDGGVFSFGNAQFYGSMAGKPLNGRITGMSATPDAKGYWLNGCDGGVFAFGSAPFYGSTPRYGCRGIFYN